MRFKEIAFVIVCAALLVPAASCVREDLDYGQISSEAKEEQSIEEIEEDYFVWTMSYSKHVFAWHYVSSVIIFFFVMAIIAMGLYFSYMQFRESTRSNRKTEIAPSTMKLGQAGVEISSSVIGLLILVVSLAFFYLYLGTVYPVKVLPGLNDSPGSSDQ